MSTIDDGQRSNKQNLSRLRKENYFDKKVTKYQLEKDAVNLKKPSDEVIASNRAKVQNYLRRKRISSVNFILLVVLAVSWIMYMMS